MELCEMIRDDIIPLALEYYLGVIETDHPEDMDEDEDNSDDDKDKKKSKKGGKGKDNKKEEAELPKDAKPEDCKQQ